MKRIVLTKKEITALTKLFDHIEGISEGYLSDAFYWEDHALDDLYGKVIGEFEGYEELKIEAVIE
tara:strand:+ start:1183 stop:1377 length:195 start_codon:yes stop_codon:yes gene_type:complete